MFRAKGTTTRRVDTEDNGFYIIVVGKAVEFFNNINRGYELFISRCAEGRNTTNDEIKLVAEGRVWTGADALSLGLVDVLGGLDEAIAIAAAKADLTDNYAVA